MANKRFKPHLKTSNGWETIYPETLSEYVFNDTNQSKSIKEEIDDINKKTVPVVIAETYSIFGYLKDIYYVNTDIIALTDKGNLIDFINNKNYTVPSPVDSMYVTDTTIYILSVDNKIVYSVDRSTFTESTTYDLSTILTDCNIASSRFVVINSEIFLITSETINNIIYKNIIEINLTTLSIDYNIIEKNTNNSTNTFFCFDYIDKSRVFAIVGNMIYEIKNNTIINSINISTSNKMEFVSYYNSIFYICNSGTSGLLVNWNTKKQYNLSYNGTNSFPGYSASILSLSNTGIMNNNKIGIFVCCPSSRLVKLEIDFSQVSDNTNTTFNYIYTHYDYVSKGIRCVYYNNTYPDKYVLASKSQTNQIHMMNEDVSSYISSYINNIYDNLKNVVSSNNEKVDKTTFDNLANKVFSGKTSLTEFVDLDTLCGSSIYNGIYVSTGGFYVAKNLPISRIAYETVLICVYNCDNSLTTEQVCVYSKQHKTFYRVYDSNTSTWSLWQYNLQSSDDNLHGLLLGIGNDIRSTDLTDTNIVRNDVVNTNIEFSNPKIKTYEKNYQKCPTDFPESLVLSIDSNNIDGNGNKSPYPYNIDETFKIGTFDYSNGVDSIANIDATVKPSYNGGFNSLSDTSIENFTALNSLLNNYSSDTTRIPVFQIMLKQNTCINTTTSILDINGCFTLQHYGWQYRFLFYTWNGDISEIVKSTVFDLPYDWCLLTLVCDIQNDTYSVYINNELVQTFNSTLHFDKIYDNHDTTENSNYQKIKCNGDTTDVIKFIKIYDKFDIDSCIKNINDIYLSDSFYEHPITREEMSNLSIQNIYGGFNAGNNSKSYSNGVAIGSGAISNALNAVQLGTGTNTEKDSLQIGDYKLLKSNGFIPNSRYSNIIICDSETYSHIKEISLPPNIDLVDGATIRIQFTKGISTNATDEIYINIDDKYILPVLVNSIDNITSVYNKASQIYESNAIADFIFKLGEGISVDEMINNGFLTLQTIPIASTSYRSESDIYGVSLDKYTYDIEFINNMLNIIHGNGVTKSIDLSTLQADVDLETIETQYVDIGGFIKLGNPINTSTSVFIEDYNTDLYYKLYSINIPSDMDYSVNAITFSIGVLTKEHSFSYYIKYTPSINIISGEEVGNMIIDCPDRFRKMVSFIISEKTSSSGNISTDLYIKLNQSFTYDGDIYDSSNLSPITIDFCSIISNSVTTICNMSETLLSSIDDGYHNNREISCDGGLSIFARDILDLSNSVINFKNPISINGIKIDRLNIGSKISNFYTCNSASTDIAKIISNNQNGCTFNLYIGSRVTVKFVNGNTSENPTLNINGTGDKAIYYRGERLSKNDIATNMIIDLVYTGEYYEVVGYLGEKFNG